ncbi:MAG TPA: NUDIX domain-containing protein [Nitrospirales bacterium]|jgi:8-oxo-dGTP pyrophosphatase MutT (NUDIX family)
MEAPSAMKSDPGDDSRVWLTGSDAVAAIIQVEDGRYLMQHRDSTPEIWYPDHWGCFGGAVHDGEDPQSALRREVYEELEFKLGDATYFTRFDFDLTGLQMGRYYRIYYIVPMTLAELGAVVLHEGNDVQAFSGEAVLNTLRVTPYDAFAMFLYHERKRLGPERPVT